jgi:hypothetical protein
VMMPVLNASSASDLTLIALSDISSPLLPSIQSMQCTWNLGAQTRQPHRKTLHNSKNSLNYGADDPLALRA